MRAPSPMPIFFIRDENLTVDGSMCGSGDFSSERSSMSKKRAPGICSARYSFLGSRLAVGRCQLPSRMTRSGEERWLASQSVSTIQFLADFGKAHPVHGLDGIYSGGSEQIGKYRARRKLLNAANACRAASFFERNSVETERRTPSARSGPADIICYCCLKLCVVWDRCRVDR